MFKKDDRVLFFSSKAKPTIDEGDVVISFVAPDTPEERKAERAAKDAEKNDRNNGAKSEV